MSTEETKRPEFDHYTSDPDLGAPKKEDEEPAPARRTGIGFSRVGIDFAVGPNPPKKEG